MKHLRSLKSVCLLLSLSFGSVGYVYSGEVLGDVVAEGITEEALEEATGTLKGNFGEAPGFSGFIDTLSDPQKIVLANNPDTAQILFDEYKVNPQDFTPNVEEALHTQIDGIQTAEQAQEFVNNWYENLEQLPKDAREEFGLTEEHFTKIEQQLTGAPPEPTIPKAPPAPSLEPTEEVEPSKKFEKKIAESNDRITKLEGQLDANPGDTNLQEELGKERANLESLESNKRIVDNERLYDQWQQAREEVNGAKENLNNLKNKIFLSGEEPTTAELEAQIADQEKVVKELEATRDDLGKKLAQTNQLDLMDRATAWGDRITLRSGLESAFNMFTHVASLVVVGLVFSLGSYITGTIQEAFLAKTRHDTLSKPQRFADIWMQIPSGLLTAADKPAPDLSIYLYVGLDADPKDNNVGRSKHAGTDEYLKTAPIFIPATKYDEWGTVALTDPRFPGYMVHANTGFHFVSGGEGVPGEELIQFFGEVPHGGESLQFHLDQLEGYVTKGFSGKAFFEYREVKSGYKGEPVIGNRFDQELNKDFVKRLYPEFAQEGEGWGSILNDAIAALREGIEFEGYHLRPFRALSTDELKEIGGANPPLDKPYFAFGQYVYETTDTPNIQSVRANLQSDPRRAALADKVVEYVVMVDDENNIVPLEMPRRMGPYNFPAYELNLKTHKMLSLFDGTFYQEGKTRPSGMDVTKILSNYFPQGVDQINAMKTFVTEQLRYGPFVAGDVKLTIDKKLQNAGVPVYKVPKKLENGQDDYVVATVVMEVTSLPGSPSHYVSLVTSRIYDQSFIPYDKPHAGKKDMPYTVYKVADNQPPLVVAGVAQPKYGTPISQGLSAPLYSLFMDPDVNPNTIKNKDIVQKHAQWLAQKLGRVKNGAISWPLPVPVPDQWALSDRGPIIKKGTTQQRISQLLSQSAPDLKKTIEATYAAWKKFMVAKSPEEIDRMLGIFPWASTALRMINVRATSAEDVKRGNYIYTSPYYPGEYLVLAENKEGTQGVGKEFNVANPQPYLLSLSTGNVYAKPDGEPVSHVDINSLLNRVKQAQGGMSSSLEQSIKNSQAGVQVLAKDPYGSTVNFGPFTFYVLKADADRGQFIYADVTDIKNYKEQAQKGTLLNNTKNFYVGIELKEGVGEEGQNSPSNWMFGNALGPKTFMVLSIVDGILYNRNGSYIGYFKEFSYSITNNLDIKKGYIDLIFDYLKTTWQQEGKSTELRGELKNRIIALTQKTYNLLLKQKNEIEQAELIEARSNQPMDANLLANIKAQPYLEEAQRFGRHLKKYRDSFYAVDPDGHSITDFNVGDPNKDNKVGVVYTSDGKPVLQLYSWVLDSARAFNGVYVEGNGKQTLDVMINHPAIPMKGMVKLDLNAVKGRYQKAQKDLAAARDQFAKNPTDKNAQNKFNNAAIELALAQRLYTSAQSISGIKNFEFYFNKNIGLYFVKDGTQFIDLVNGYEFNADGSVRLAQDPALVSDKPSKDILFVGTDATGLFVAQFKGDKKEYSQLLLLDQSVDKNRPAVTIYTMADVDTGNEYRIYYDSEKNEYKIVRLDDNNKEIAVGTYRPSSSIVYSHTPYMSTGKGAQRGSYVKEDADQLHTTYILWDGGPKLNLKQIYYRKNLIPLTKQGDTTFTGRYKDGKGATKNITVKEQQVKHGEHTTGHYLSITDAGKTYNFMYLAGIIDLKRITSCEKERKIEHLDMWKQCTWEINVIADAYGVSKIVKSLPKRLPRVPAEDVERVKKQAGNRAPVVQANMDRIKYDQELQRYVYQVTANDEGWPYYKISIKDWYVDLKTGIAYNPDSPSKGAYPLSTLMLSQLFILLDRLEISVAQVQRKDGSIGDGLVYRSPMVVTQEVGKMKVLNQAIVNIAEGKTLP